MGLPQKGRGSTLSSICNSVTVAGHSYILANAGSNFSVMFTDVSQVTKLEQYKAYNRHMINVCLMGAKKH